jgi:hypothetical protein
MTEGVQQKLTFFFESSAAFKPSSKAKAKAKKYTLKSSNQKYCTIPDPILDIIIDSETIAIKQTIKTGSG